MKYLKLTCLIASSVLFLQCKSTKTAGKDKTDKTVVHNDGGVPNASDLIEAKKEWASATEENLKLGYTIYTTRCTKCHEMDKPSKLTEEKWLKVIDVMAPKAKLTAPEKEALIQYTLANKRANAK